MRWPLAAGLRRQLGSLLSSIAGNLEKWIRPISPLAKITDSGYGRAPLPAVRTAVTGGLVHLRHDAGGLFGNAGGSRDRLRGGSRPYHWPCDHLQGRPARIGADAVGHRQLVQARRLYRSHHGNQRQGTPDWKEVPLSPIRYDLPFGGSIRSAADHGYDARCRRLALCFSAGL
jgi:hypothetical protein